MKRLTEIAAPFSSCMLPQGQEVWISSICADSKLAEPGSLFIARKGTLQDGALYAAEAVARGSAALLTEQYLPAFPSIPQIICADPAAIEAKLAAHYYDFPAQELCMIGVTGTNGKTTTSWILYQLLCQLGRPAGWIGTIEYRVGSASYPASRTTPGASHLQKLMREMCDAGCRSAVMEVTSHALDQGRVAEIEFDAALFTNLTPDHLDYHKDMESYCAAKNRLFRGLGQGSKKKSKWAVVNRDSPWHKRVLEGCTTPILTYGIEGDADLRASGLTMTPDGMALQLLFQGTAYRCQIPYIGRYNVSNVLGAIAFLLTQGVDLNRVLPLLEDLPPVRGRLEPVKNGLGIRIYVDFAHTGDGLKQVLSTLSAVKQRRLLLVFGCGGDRDRRRRKEMAEAAEAYADHTIITSDNPRSEDPEAICAEIARAFRSPSRYSIEADRLSAIRRVLEQALPEDIVLIAGKGHETYQIQGSRTLHFDDVEVVSNILKSRD